MAEKKVIELEIKSESLGSLKSQLREAQNQVTALSEKFGATSQEAINAAKRAAELKDAISDAKALTDAFNPDAKFNALSSSIGGVLNGFQAFEGTLGLIGVESKDVQDALLKVQSAMALSQGLQGLMEAKDSFKQLGAVIGQTAIGQKLLNAAQIAGAAAMRVLNVVMAANPILLVVAAIGALSGALYLFSRDTETAAEANDKLNASLTRMNESVEASNEKLTKAGENRLKILESQGASEETLHKQRLQNLSNEEKARKYSLKAEEETLKHKRAIYKQALEEEDYELAKTIQGEIKASEKRYKKLNSQHTDYVTNKTVENNKFSQYEKDQLEKAAEKEKDAAEKRRQANKEANEKRIAAEKEKNERLKRLAEEKAAFDLEQEILDETRQEQAYKRKLDAAEQAAVEEKAMEDAARNEKLAAEIADEKRQEEAWAREQEGIKKLQELKYQAVLQGLTLISDLAEVFGKKGEKQAKKAFQIQKAASIASALVQTYQSATAAYASQFVPIPDPTSPIRGAVAAGIAIAAGIGNVAKISLQKFEGGGASAGGSSGVSAGSIGGGTPSNVITPNFNIVGNNQATNPLSMLGSQPIQAYVVSGEVTTAQSLDRNRMNTATFG